MSFALDNASGTLTAIGTYINSQSLDAAITMLDETGMGDSDPEAQNGMSNRSVPISGIINTTTGAIFRPLIEGTTVRKQFEFGLYSGSYVNGSCLPESVSISGSPDSLETFSCTLRVVGSTTGTSTSVVGG
jgi:hypothetical protein